MSATLPKENSPTRYRHSNFFTTQNHHTCLFPHFSKYPQFQAKNRRNWTPKLVLAATNQRLRITEQEQSQEEEEEEKEDAGEEEEEEEEEYDYLEDESSLLSLSEKPDRNMALLDEYEMEEHEYAADPNHRSGYVAVLGKPNVGKSTLSDQMVGQKLPIVTDKPQTTRHRILGICSGTDYQMILYDTPGVMDGEESAQVGFYDDEECPECYS